MVTEKFDISKPLPPSEGSQVKGPPSPRKQQIANSLTSSVVDSTVSATKSESTQSRTSIMATTTVAPFENKQTLRCLFCGGGRCNRCGPTAYQSLESPAIPNLHSSWITDDILAMQRPNDGLLKEGGVLDKFIEHNIGAVFNLTEPGEHPYCGGNGNLDSGFPYSPEKLMAVGIKHFNYSWPDMKAPSMNLMRDIVQVACNELHEGNKIAVHCHAGYGRTGIAVACILISQGTWGDADAIITRVRARRPGSIQTKKQSTFVHAFEQAHKKMMQVFPAVVDIITAPTAMDSQVARSRASPSSSPSSRASALGINWTSTPPSSPQKKNNEEEDGADPSSSSSSSSSSNNDKDAAHSSQTDTPSLSLSLSLSHSSSSTQSKLSLLLPTSSSTSSSASSPITTHARGQKDQQHELITIASSIRNQQYTMPNSLLHGNPILRWLHRLIYITSTAIVHVHHNFSCVSESLKGQLRDIIVFACIDTSCNAVNEINNINTNEVHTYSSSSSSSSSYSSYSSYSSSSLSPSSLLHNNNMLLSNTKELIVQASTSLTSGALGSSSLALNDTVRQQFLDMKASLNNGMWEPLETMTSRLCQEPINHQITQTTCIDESFTSHLILCHRLIFQWLDTRADALFSKHTCLLLGSVVNLNLKTHGDQQGNGRSGQGGVANNADMMNPLPPSSSLVIVDIIEKQLDKPRKALLSQLVQIIKGVCVAFTNSSAQPSKEDSSNTIATPSTSMNDNIHDNIPVIAILLSIRLAVSCTHQHKHQGLGLDVPINETLSPNAMMHILNKVIASYDITMMTSASQITAPSPLPAAAAATPMGVATTSTMMQDNDHNDNNDNNNNNNDNITAEQLDDVVIITRCLLSLVESDWTWGNKTSSLTASRNARTAIP